MREAETNYKNPIPLENIVASAALICSIRKDIRLIMNTLKLCIVLVIYYPFTPPQRVAFLCIPLGG